MIRDWKVLLCALAAALAAGCGGGGGGGGGGAGVTPPPDLPLGVLIYPAPLYCGAQLDTDPLVFVFTRSMYTSYPADLSGTPFVASTLSWSKTLRTNDTLTITPTTPAWTTGVDLLTFSSFDALNGNPIDFYYTPGIAAGLPPLIYVNGDTGLDTNDGMSPATAVKSIAQGIVRAAGVPAVILVAASNAVIPGTTDPNNGNVAYRGYDLGTSTLAMTNGISLCGGFNPTFTVRDPVAYETVLVNTASSGGGTLTAPLATIGADSSVTTATVLEGFTIVAPGMDTTGLAPTGYTGALDVGGGLQVRNNKLISGGPINTVILSVHGNPGIADTQAIFSKNNLKGSPNLPIAPSRYGLYVFGALPVFESSYIGSSIYGVYIDNTSTPGPTTISNSDIDGGKIATGASFGIYVVQANVKITNNISINGGGDFTLPAASNTATAIYFNGGTGTITNNLIFGGNAVDNTGVYISTTSTVTMTQNNVFGGDGNTAIAVDDLGPSTVLDFNDLHGHSSSNSVIALRSTGAGSRIYSRNQILGGVSGGTNVGIQLGSTTNGIAVRMNEISGCGNYTGFSMMGPCLAVENNDANNFFLNNTINGGRGTQVWPATLIKSIAYKEGSTATGSIIKNNLFFTSADGTLGAAGGRCMDIFNSATLMELSHSDLFACGEPDVYFDQSLGFAYSITDVILTFQGGDFLADFSTVSIDPGFTSIGASPGQVGDSDVDLHLTSGSPAAVRGGGFIFDVCGFKDRDDTNFWPDTMNGAAGGWAMGAYHSLTQTPGGC